MNIKFWNGGKNEPSGIFQYSIEWLALGEEGVRERLIIP